MNRRIEKLQLSVAWRLPRWLVYWASIRLMAHATQGEYSNQDPGELNVMEALKRWERGDER